LTSTMLEDVLCLQVAVTTLSLCLLQACIASAEKTMQEDISSKTSECNDVRSETPAVTRLVQTGVEYGVWQCCRVCRGHAYSH